MTEPGELPIPDAAREDTKAIELVRVWAAGGEQHVSLATNVWKDPANWGIMLVDLAHHVANSYALVSGRERGDVLARLKEAFDVEWQSPTDAARGELLGNDSL